MKPIQESEVRAEAKEIIRRFISESFLASAGLDTVEDDDSFMERGIIDSTGVLELLEFLEGKFEIKIQDEEVIPDNLDSLNRLGDFVQRKIERTGTKTRGG